MVLGERITILLCAFLGHLLSDLPPFALELKILISWKRSLWSLGSNPALSPLIRVWRPEIL